MTRFTGRYLIRERPMPLAQVGEVRTSAWVCELPDWTAWLELHPELDAETVERLGARRIVWTPAEPIGPENGDLIQAALAAVLRDARPAPAATVDDSDSGELTYERDE